MKGFSPTKKELEELAKTGKIKGFTWPEKEAIKKKNKYLAEKVVFDGMEFDSKKEASRYYDLKLRVLANEISNLRRQVEYSLEVQGAKVASYFADFVYIEKGIEVVEDVKSAYTRKLSTYRLKKKLMKAIHMIEIYEV